MEKKWHVKEFGAGGPPLLVWSCLRAVGSLCSGGSVNTKPLQWVFDEHAAQQAAKSGVLTGMSSVS